MKTPLRESLLYKLTTPEVVLFTLFSYSIGIGLAHHLGINLDSLNVFLGLLMCLLLIEMRNFLMAYFEHPESHQSSLSRSDPLFEQLLGVKRMTLLQISLLILTAGAMITVLVVFRGDLHTATFLYLGLGFLLCFFSAVPPLRLLVHGYGEIAEAILLAYLFPAMAFSMQGESTHILLVMLTLPLVFFYLAMSIARSFKTFGYDATHDKKNLVTMLGWQKSVTVHNLFVLIGFFLIAVFLLVGLPWSLAWPVLLGLPVGLFQIYLVMLMAMGGKPRWQLLSLTSSTLFILETYLISLTLWIK
jgi:1,4-dihydroxy-2-naphthoate octaprenyltransferase